MKYLIKISKKYIITVLFVDILSSNSDEIKYLNEESRFSTFSYFVVNLKILFGSTEIFKLYYYIL